MTETEVTQKIEAIRKELRDGREQRGNDSISGTSEDSNRHSTVGDTKKQRVSRNLRSNDEPNGGNIGSLDNLESSLNQESFRSGRRSGRSSESHISLDTVTDNVGRSNESSRTQSTAPNLVGNLLKDDATKEYNSISEETVKIPRIVVPRSVGRPRKAPEEVVKPTASAISIPQRPIGNDSTKVKNPISTLIGKGKTLTEYEAKSIKEPFRSALEDDGRYIDQLLTYRTGMTQPIWGDMDDDELDKLSSFMLKQGQRSPIAATAVRGISEGSEYLAVGAIVLPRIQKTVSVLRSSQIVRPKLHKSRLERIKEEINKANES